MNSERKAESGIFRGRRVSFAGVGFGKEAR